MAKDLSSLIFECAVEPGAADGTVKIVSKHGVVALVKAHGKKIEAGPLLAAAPEMLAALKAVNKLVAEAAMTGFNHADGDWPDRLYLSQQATSWAIRRAEGRS